MHPAEADVRCALASPPTLVGYIALVTTSRAGCLSTQASLSQACWMLRCCIVPYFYCACQISPCVCPCSVFAWCVAKLACVLCLVCS